MNKEMEITFHASGYMTQTIVLTEKFKHLSKQDVVDGLNSGKYVTTIHGEDSYIEDSNDNKIAKIEDQNNELTYEGFE